MKILFLSFYYYPDLCAGSFRNTALLHMLLEAVSTEDHIEVITTAPNRYSDYSVDAPAREAGSQFEIHRLELPPHKSGFFDQSRAFSKYAEGVLAAVKGRNYDLVYASSSRLMTAALGAIIAKRKGAQLYLDVRDIFVDSMGDILPRIIKLPILSFFNIVERLAFSRASKINIVSEGFRPYFQSRYPSIALSQFTNGIDSDFLNERSSAKVRDKKDSKIVVLYAGNIGSGQGLHKIIPELAERLSDRVIFRIIGSGGQKRRLEDALNKRSLGNVELVDPVSRERLVEEYLRSDVLFLHLNDYQAFEKVLPSKLFEYAAMNKPIWAGLTGYSALFASQEIENCAVFSPMDVENGIEALDNLEISNTVRTTFVKKFRRDDIMKKMAEDLLETGRQNV